MIDHLKTEDVNWERNYFDFESHPLSSFALKNPEVEVFNGDFEAFLYLLLLKCWLFFTLLISFIDNECSIGSIVSSIPPIS